MNKEWPMVSVKEILTPVSRPENVIPEKTYRILGAHWYAKGLYTKDIKSGAQVQAKNLYRIEEGDFVYNRLFAWKGSFAVATNENHGCYVSNEFPCFAVNKNIAETDYLWKYFSRASIWDESLSLSSGGTPTSRNRLKEEKLLSMKIPLPPLSGQQRIVMKIEEITRKTDEAQKLRQESVEEADILFLSVRSKCLSHVLVKYGSASLGNFVSMSSGEGLNASQLNDSLDYPVYGGGGFVGRYSRFLFEEPKIAIGRVGARCGCIFITEPKSWITDNALYLTEISDRLDKRFLVHVLRNVDLRQQANQAAQPVVSQKKINPIQIPVPPLPEQHRIVKFLDDFESRINELKKLQVETQKELDAMMPSILDKAFKGDL